MFLITEYEYIVDTFLKDVTNERRTISIQNNVIKNLFIKIMCE
jgi:hypothetical protein